MFGKFEIKVLNLSGVLPENILSQMAEQGVLVIDEREHNESIPVDLIFTNCTLLQLGVIAQKYKRNNKNLPIISFHRVEDYGRFFEYGGVGVFDLNLLTYPEFEHALLHYVRKANSLRINDSFSGKLRLINTFKLVNHFHNGYYTDLLAADVVANGHDIASIRTHFNSLSTYLTYLSDQGIINLPAEIHYGDSENSFVLQTVCSCSGFVLEYLEKSLEGNYTLERPFANSLRIAFESCEFLNIQYLKMSNKMVINSVWLKNSIKRSKFRFPSMLISDVRSYQDLQNIARIPKVNPKVVEYGRSDVEIKNLAEIPLVGESVRHIRDNNSYLLNKPVLYKEILEFIEKYSGVGDLESMDTKDIKDALSDFPHQEIVTSLRDRDYELLREALKNASLKEFVLENAEKAIEALHGNKNRLDGYLDDLQQRFLKHSIIDDMEMIKVVGKYEEDDAKFRVKLKGVREDLTPEAWKVKRMYLDDRIKDIIEEAKSGKKEISQLKEEVVHLVAKELKAENKDVRPVIDELFEGVAKRITNDSFEIELLNKWDVEDNLFDNEVAKKEIAIRDQQLIRMKTLMDKMRGELNRASMKAAEGATESFEDQILKIEKKKLKKDLEIRNKEIDRLKRNQESILEAKSNEIRFLKVQIERIKVNNKKSISLSNKDNSLSTEEVAKHQSQILNLRKSVDDLRKMHKTMNVEYMKSQEENIILRNKLKKIEVKEMEEEEYNEIKKEMENIDSQEFNLDDSKGKDWELIQELNAFKISKDALEEDKKNLQSRIKMLEEQIVKLADRSKNNQAAGGNAASNLQIKRLESMHQKMEERYLKTAKELKEKKAEGMKYKQEVQKLSHQVQSLERKLIISEKKKAS